MSIYSINDVSTTSDRYKLYTLLCNSDRLSQNITFIQSHNINVINIGKELGNFLDKLEDYKYLVIDTYDFTKKLLENKKAKINNLGNDVIAIYNLGILFEPVLEINVVQLLTEFAKSAALIIIWENRLDIPNKLNWPQQRNLVLDFSDTPLKKLQYAI